MLNSQLPRKIVVVAVDRRQSRGWLLHAVSRWLGHTKLTTTDTYLNATTQLLHELTSGNR
jgi:hypothetical protein